MSDNETKDKTAQSSADEASAHLAGWVPVSPDICEMCGGTGQLRANYTNDQGKYIFHKEPCHICDGRGFTEYVKCTDCYSLVPVGYQNEHICGD